MSGNATEEGLIGQLNNPSHTDPARITVPFAAIAGLLAFMVLSYHVPDLSSWAKALISFGLFFSIYGIAARILDDRILRALAREMETRRAAQIRETERRIAQMKENKDA